VYSKWVGARVYADGGAQISFCGIRVVTWYERLAWLPVLVSVLVALGVGGKHLSLGAGPAPEPATAAAVLSFASVVAGFVITYAPLGSDYTTYLHRGAPGWKLFLYSYAGLVLPIASLQVLGAAAALAAAQHAPWGAAFADGDVGALLRAMLQGTGGGGAFLTALLALSVVGNVAPTMYSFGLNVQVFVPWAVRVPRYVFALLAAAMCASARFPVPRDCADARAASCRSRSSARTASTRR
jgi:purine-cytosine permease-like protein